MERNFVVPRFLLIFVILLGLVGVFFMMKPFIGSIMMGLLVAYVFYPVYRKANKYIRNETITSFLMVFFIFILLVIPVFLIIKALLSQSLDFYRNFNYDIILGFISNYIDPNTAVYVKTMFDEMLLFVAKETSKFILSLPHKIISAFVMFFILFYSFKEGRKIPKIVKGLLPLKEKYKEELIMRFKEVVNALTYGLVVTAIIQGFLGTIGLMIFDVKNPLLWGLLMTFFAMLPLFGTGLVWFPAAMYKIFTGDVFNGIGLFLYGALIVSTIDNILRPKLISNKSRLHPVTVLLGILGGLALFGSVGIIIGPLIISIMLLFFDFYKR